jgi:bifunctional non-homologous end joining protein LigD
MGLRDYIKKRRFDETPEPKGGSSGKGKLKFVVQQHHATARHYDFRLEMDGVLKSWAVPKGPSMNPHDHHLAIQTEDHPYDYRKFEGVIPEGNYGAGNVIIWDEGWYEPRDPRGSEKSLLKDLKKGHITFIVHGKKLKGEFALIHMEGHKEKEWLLIKKSDEYATEADITKQDGSIKSHKHVDDLGAHGKLPDLSKYPKKATPWAVKPMLATLVDNPFSREGWVFEIKWDGYRAIASKKGAELELYSRNGLNFVDRYGPVVEAMKALDHDVILDGEVAVIDKDGHAHFEWLQDYPHSSQGLTPESYKLCYCIFDILWCDGHDVRDMPLLQRKALLKSVMPTHPALLYSDHIETDGLQLFKHMQKQGLEGMIAKQANSTYRENVRGDAWLKIKTSLRQEVVIGGYTEPRGGRKYLGSLIVGTYENGQLHYAGHSGGGIADADRKKLRDRLARIERKSSPFVTEPKPNAPVHWVRPELVGEMEFSEWTSEGYMRHPQFKGLRPDKKPTQVRREKPQLTKIPPVKGPSSSKGDGGLPFEQTHLDKVFFPKYKYTKGDLFKYYESVAQYILPYLQDRPMSMNRMPNGITGESFYQKNNEHLPDWVPSADIFSESNNENLHWIVGGDLNTLLYMVQLGCIELHPWNSRVGHLEKPDWIVIDLDPEGVKFTDVIEVAKVVHQVCDEWKIPTYPKTSGKTGIHVFIPLGAKYTYEQAKNVAHLIVLEVNQRMPGITSVERMPEKRKHKIYLDFLQNREGQTLAAPYSARPIQTANVSMPLHWEEVKKGLDPSDFTIKNTLSRLKRTGDLWKPVMGKGIDLQKILENMEK